MSRRTRTKERTRPEPAPPSSRPELEPAPVAGPFFAQDLSLKLLVFAAGAVLMGLEIAGSRVLAPHFGNSVFVWGSLISVFLIALSVGYYVGGRVADRYPSRVVLNSICILAALAIFLIALSAHVFCEVLVEKGLGEQTGPLVASAILFLPPSVGLGMVSPFAIRLATQSVRSVGQISGTLYALSTGGSIAGTLLTTFVLIPLIGLSAILKGLGLVLLLAAVLTLPLWKPARTPAGLAVLALLTLAGLFAPGAPRTALGRGDRLVVDVDTPYHHIAVVDNRDARLLRFDRFVESSILKQPPYPSLSPYTDYFHLAFLVHPRIERTLFIGAGGGVGPRAFHLHDRDMTIDVVDIDPRVLELARSHFFLDETPRIRTIAEDGRMFVRTAPARYDCVVLDAFTIGGRIPFHLVTREFFQLCRDRMTERGVFVMNLNSAVDGPLARIFQSMYRTVAGVFPQTYVFAKDYLVAGRHQSVNVILLATRDPERVPPEAWVERAAGHQSRSYITAERMQKMARDLVVELPPLADAPVFTDDYAPIETMPF